MAKFEIAYLETMNNEGGYVNHPDDKGGETIFGISRRYHAAWKGWAVVDYQKMFCTEKEGSKEFCKELTDLCRADDGIKQCKYDFYRGGFWDIINLDKIKDQQVANAIFDASVNHDPRDAAKMAQEVAGVKVDGIIGNISIEAINNIYPATFLDKFYYQRMKKYQEIVAKDPSQKAFMLGWRARAERFKKYKI